MDHIEIILVEEDQQMNNAQRRQNANQGIALLKAVILDVLQEEPKNPEDNLDATNIADRAGFPENTGGRRLSRAVLELLRSDRKVENLQPGPGAWRLL